MDIRERRSLLVISENPERKINYVTTLRGEISFEGQLYELNLCYIPDRSILKMTAFEIYAHELSKLNWDSPEDLAVTVLSDINNELICRWVQVSLCSVHLLNDAKCAHKVVIEDRQPGWDNPHLLGRLSKI